MGYQLFGLLSLVRVYNLFWVILAQYFVAFFIFGVGDAKLLLLQNFELHLIVFITSCIIAAGYILNHLYDSQKDLINRPYKSIIDAQISRGQKWSFLVGINVLALMISLFISLKSFLFFNFYIFSIWMYSHRIKRIPLLGNFFAATLSVIPILAVSIYFNRFDLLNAYQALFLFLLLLIKELIKDLENLKGDLALSYATYVVENGEHSTKKIIALLAVGCIISAALLFEQEQMQILKPYFLYTIIFLGALTVTLFLVNNNRAYLFLYNFVKLNIVMGIASLAFLDQQFWLEIGISVRQFLQL
ncbi:MAG: ubiquinone biosynthesis protein UbiA [Flavobacteriaceae bacterium]|nr:ubiquinone biosynthesis protein UbiA [Flavobacteriaceae bacterium]